jgi:hypothetical protein
MSTLSKTIEDAKKKRWKTQCGEFPLSDGTEWYPQTRTEFRERLMLDPQYFLSTCCEITDRRGTGYVPFIHNAAQRRYDDEITYAGVDRDVDAKVRKWGLTVKRLGNGVHGSCYGAGRFGLAVAQSEAPAKELGKVIRTFYESAWKYFGDIGQDPAYYLPRITSDTVYGLVFGDIGSQYLVSWSGARGLGRLVAIHDLYITELAEWEGDVESAITGLLTAKPPGAHGVRQTIDFNAHTNWMGTEAYNIWEAANEPQDSDEWNGFTPFFIGVKDLPEYYTPEFLAEQRQTLEEKQYKLQYPTTVEDLYTQRDQCVFNVEHLKACVVAEYATGCDRYVLGVDTSPGKGGDYQVCVVMGWTGDLWQQACPAIRERVPEDVFGEHVDAMARRYPGTVVVEANVGSAVLVRLKELGTPGLYKHKHRDKDTGRQEYKLGFQTSYASKRVQLMELQQMFREGTIAIVDEWLFDELRDFEWKETDEQGRGKLAGAPDRSRAHDDGVAALWCFEAGTHYNWIDWEAVRERVA